ncbi:hypothetical protein ACTWQL_20665 [Pseudalkalibacillus sp. R45]|uniref:hypothetical protein n=1 Tax=Pseudalkalibacillus sp. R45 TaxID=3457433 RepID=UPI003FCD66AA
MPCEEIIQVVGTLIPQESRTLLSNQLAQGEFLKMIHKQQSSRKEPKTIKNPYKKVGKAKPLCRLSLSYPYTEESIFFKCKNAWTSHRRSRHSFLSYLTYLILLK